MDQLAAEIEGPMTIKTNAEGGYVVLIVEDDLAHAELIRHCFDEQELAIDLHHMQDGEQALDYLYARGRFSDPAIAPRPVLVILDLRLPLVDGMEVLRHMKADDDLSSIPVVVLTSSSAVMDVAKAHQYHANSYCVKPVDFAEFEALISDMGNYWLRRHVAHQVESKASREA